MAGTGWNPVNSEIILLARKPTGCVILCLCPTLPNGVRPTCKTSIELTATIFTLFEAILQEAEKEVTQPKAAPTLLWWRPMAAIFVVAMNTVDVVALNTILVLRLSKTGWTVGRTDSRLDGWSVGRTDRS